MISAAEFVLQEPMVEANSSAVVYGLFTSSDQQVRYVGQTIRSLKDRLIDHVNWARRGGKSALFAWIRKHEAQGEKIRIKPIVRDAIFNETEIQIIAYYRALGTNLVNSTSGGMGIRDFPRTKEHGAKISASLRGKKRGPLTDEQKANLSAILKTRVFTDEHKRKISEARKAQGISPDAQARMAEGRRNSPLWRASLKRLPASMKGK